MNTKSNRHNIMPTHKPISRLIVTVSITILILLIPLIAMQFTDQVEWKLFDFIVAAVMLLSLGFMCNIVLIKVKRRVVKITICIAIILLFALLWAELAVGILNTALSGH